DSVFMGSIGLDLNPQFNALIGGRGTGKSTILEYIRFAMQDQPAPAGSDSHAFYDDVSRKRESLVQDTLCAKGGKVFVAWLVNGVPHEVCCDSATTTLTIKVGNGESRPV